MNAINGLLDAWRGIGAAWDAFWGLLSPIGDQITIACVQAAPQLCVWLDEGWMQIMGYHLLMNGAIFGSVNVWYCWHLYKTDKSITWYYPNQRPERSDGRPKQDSSQPDQPPRADQPLSQDQPPWPERQSGAGKDNRSFWIRVMNWLGWE